MDATPITTVRQMLKALEDVRDAYYTDHQEAMTSEGESERRYHTNECSTCNILAETEAVIIKTQDWLKRNGIFEMEMGE